MLVITRKPGQSIRINDDITIFLIKIRGNQVSIGIDAPFDVAIQRDEIYEKIKDDKAKKKNDNIEN